MSVTAGSSVHSTATYRDPQGPVDPPDPAVAVIDPDGDTVAVGLVPVRDGVGLFHLDYVVPAQGPPGVWVFRWSGTINGALVYADDPIAVMVAPLATVDGVHAFVPSLPAFTPSSKPSNADVAVYLDLTGGQVEAAVARSLAALDLLEAAGVVAADVVDRWRAQVRSLAELGAAAMAFDAAYPELAAASETDQRYGAALWNRYRQGLADLPKQLAEFLAQFDETAAGDPAVPAVSGPAPMFTRDMRW